MELTPLPAGYTLVDQYVIQSVLGSGGFGIVYGVMSGQPVPEATDRIQHDTYRPLSTLLSREAYRLEFLRGIDWALSLDLKRRPQSIGEWQSSLFPWRNLSERRALNRLRGRKIFISYRRTDTGAHAAKVYDFMVSVFGVEDVFFDVDSIPVWG
jgi:hypothetical protein